MAKRFSIQKIAVRYKASNKNKPDEQKRKGYDGFFIYDNKYKKRVSLDFFCDTMRIKKMDMLNLMPTAYKGEMTEFIYSAITGTNYEYALDIRELELLKKYKLFYNAVPVNFNFIQKKVMEFMQEIYISHITLYLWVEVKNSKFANLAIVAGEEGIIAKQKTAINGIWDEEKKKFIKPYLIEDSIGNYLIIGS
jgi:hypothetical protein